MIQHRDATPKGWAADPRVRLDTARDLQSLLEALVRRYQLTGAVIATDAGVIQAHVGGPVDDLPGLAAAIDPRVLPRYFANGPLDAYADIPKPGLIALLLRNRPEGGEGERDPLAVVSDYNVARQMTEELRNGMVRIGA